MDLDTVHKDLHALYMETESVKAVYDRYGLDIDETAQVAGKHAARAMQQAAMTEDPESTFGAMFLLGVLFGLAAKA